jgi:hypothetical protein
MKTEQQKRFEEALRQVGYTAEYYFKADANNPDGYWDDFTQCRWEGFQLGESSGLALAAADFTDEQIDRAVDAWFAHERGVDTENWRHRMRRAIRALMTQENKA